MRVLVVEDSPTLRALLKMHLRRFPDREVIFAENGQEAVERIRRDGPPDLILLDINMPVMSGFEFLDRRATLGVPPGIPIILLSTEARRDDVERGMKAGAKAYVSKPFTARDLESAIARALGREETT